MIQFLRKYFILIILLFLSITIKAQESDTTMYLITCGPGTETYSIYGHSALRVTINQAGGLKTDTVYNWGVFDFDTPNFAWKFAKGRLNYMLDSESFGRFVMGYFYEERYVLSQKIDLTASEKRTVMNLVNENLKPENKRYRYDFFYDDCSTRIRDLLEKSTEGKLVYPEEKNEVPTFRDMIGKYQAPYPWLQFGIDLLVGSPADIPAGVRDRMFLPLDMMAGLSETTVQRNGENSSLLEPAEVILDFAPPVVNPSFFLSPVLIFSLLLVVVIVLSLRFRQRAQNNAIDFTIFFILSLVALVILFFTFFSDHQQVKWNFNIIWLNPFIIICLIQILFNRSGKIWFRIVFGLSLIFLLAQFFLPQQFNPAIYPLALILLLRSWLRTGFNWIPYLFRPDNV
jgi:hypothetical protein